MNAHRNSDRLTPMRWMAAMAPALLALAMAFLVMTAGSAQTPKATIDCAVDWNDGKYYFFRGDKYIRFDIEKNMADAGYPLPIGPNWSNLGKSGPLGFGSDIDCAVKWDDEKAYFFKGDKVVIYNMKKNEATLPLPFAVISPFLTTTKVDAVVKWDNKVAYFIRGRQVVGMILENLQVTGVAPLDRWFPGVTFDKIDATLNKNNEFIYFFSGDRYARYNIKLNRVDVGPASLTAWAGVSDEYWSAKTAYNDTTREFTTTFEYPREVLRVESDGQPAFIGDFKELTQRFRFQPVEKNTKQAYKAQPTFFRFSLMPLVVRKENDVVVRLTDLSDLNNACYVGPPEQLHWSGYFLDSVFITYKNLTPQGWASPAYGPESENKAGGYNHQSGFEVSGQLGFDGKALSGSFGGGWSQSQGSDTSIQDVEFESNAPNSIPEFKWKVMQMYDGDTRPVAINGNWWNVVRKTAGQVDITQSVYQAPKMVRTRFIPTSYVFYHPPRADQLPVIAQRDMRILVEYDIAYRAVHTRNLAKNDGDAFLRGFSLVFGANPGSYSGEAFRSWSTSVIRHKYAVEVVIPKEHLKTAPAN
jgi:hemopexin